MSESFVRGKGKLHDHRIRADARAYQPLLPADPHHRAHPLSQYNVGAQTRRTDNQSPGMTRTCWRFIPFDAEVPRHQGGLDGRRCSPAASAPSHLRGEIIADRMQQGVVYTTFHHAGRPAPM
jgi:formate dehydrogenase major subunit